MLFLKRRYYQSFSMREAIDADKSTVIVFSRKGKCASSHQYRCAKATDKAYMPAYVEGGEGARCQNRFRVS